MPVFDVDDFHETNHRWDLFLELKRLNPAFKVTLFAVPGMGSDEFWSEVNAHDWIELAVHGWLHPNPYECADWSADYLALILEEPVIRKHFASGFKAPGWQISDGCYAELLRRGWWVGDQHLEDGRRPEGLRTYFYEDGNYHYHVQDWGSNGLAESWTSLCEAVSQTTDFRFASEVAA